MTIKDQINRLKDNWLLILLVIILIIAVPMFSSGPMWAVSDAISYGKSMPGMAQEMSVARGGYYPEADFAPEVEERLKVKRGSLSAEVETGSFYEAEKKLKDVMTASGAYLLSENVQQYGTERFPYRTGYYNMKVETSKYDSVVSQMKDIGKVKSFNENIEDVTGRHTDLNVQLAGEKERLARYKAMYAEAKEVEDKISLSDRIFNQERTVRYLEERIDDISKDVSYSTLYVTLNEKQSGYAAITFVTVSELVTNLVGSLASLLSFVFWLLPWAIGAGIVWFGYKRLTSKKKRR